MPEAEPLGQLPIRSSERKPMMHGDAGRSMHIKE
jgi:hypothetical protein